MILRDGGGAWDSYPINFSIAYSLDDLTYTVLNSTTAFAPSCGIPCTESYNYSFSNVNARYLIFNITQWDTSTTQPEIEEFEIYGENQTSGVFVTLNSPLSGTSTSTLPITFNVSATSEMYTLANTTLYIWSSTSLVNRSVTKTLTGTEDNDILILDSLGTGTYNWNAYTCGTNATGTLCDFASANYTLTRTAYTISSTYFLPSIYETSNQRFQLNITTISEILSTSASLFYNGSSHSATATCASGSCSIISDIDIPIIAGSNLFENKSFFWQISVYDGSTVLASNTSSYEQEVNRTRLGLCNATYTTTTLNFTAYHEQNLSRINPYSFKGTFNTWLGTGNSYRTSSIENLSTAEMSLCIFPNQNFKSSAIIDYNYEDDTYIYTARNYYLQNATLDSTKQDIPLYLLDSDDSTTFILKVQDQKLSPVSGALIYIQRYYPGDGTYKTVQIAKTDDNGESIGFYEVETVDYKHIITKNGVVLLETSPQKVVGKEVPYTLTFTVGSSPASPWSYWEDNPNIQTSLTFNSTSKIVIFSYIDITGATSSGRLLVEKRSSSNYTTTTICDSTINLPSATMTCNVSDYSGTIYALGYMGSENSNLITFIINTAKEIFGREGLFMGWFIILVGGMAFLWNPTAGIVGINVSIWFVSLLGLISFSPLFIFAILAVSILALIFLKK